MTTILAQKEAEVYCAQGLHQEALRLYQHLLESSPNINKTFRQAIETKMAAIEDKLGDGPPDEHARLSASDILRLKEGWGNEATMGDLLVCAQAFYRIGHYRSALSEMIKILEQGCDIKALVGLFADCLVALCQPQRLLPTMMRVTKNTFTRPEALQAFTMLLTERMVARRHSAHALAFYRFLQQCDLIKTKAPRRLAAIAKSIEDLQGSIR